MTKMTKFMDKTNNIDWEQMRFIATSIILSGILSNYGHTIPTHRVEEAVRMADHLISILGGPDHKSICGEHYQR